jgi:hypothetical protein
MTNDLRNRRVQAISAVRNEIQAVVDRTQWELGVVTERLAELETRANRRICLLGCKSFLMLPFVPGTFTGLFISCPESMPVYVMCSLISFAGKWFVSLATHNRMIVT